MESSSAVSEAYGMAGIVLSLGFLAYWMFFFRASQSTLRDGVLVYIGLSMEVGLIVQCFKDHSDVSLNFLTVLFPIVLCIVLMITDDPPIPARRKLLTRSRLGKRELRVPGERKT